MSPEYRFSSRFASGYDRLARCLATQSLRCRLSQELERWLALNYWTPAHFALLSQCCSPPGRGLTSTDVTAVISGSRPDLMPKFFQAFAAVDARIRTSTAQPLTSDQDLLAHSATSICSDESSTRPSWWFAVYCNEPWALDKIVHTDSVSVPEPQVLRSSVPALLRRAIAERQEDPVMYLKASAQRLPRSSQLRQDRFVDWVLDYDQIEFEHLRLAIPFALMLMAELGSGHRTILDISSENH